MTKLYVVKISCAVIACAILMGGAFETRAQNKVVVIPIGKDCKSTLEAYAPLPAAGPPDSAFHASGFGYVVDNITGLVWQRGQSATKKTWPEAWAYCQNLTLPVIGGKTDWRLPNVEELLSIADYNKREPAINDAFLDTDPTFSGYWSSTTVPYEFGIADTRVMTVSFRHGSSSANDKDGTNNVRCVRSGTAVAGPNDHYKENGDGTVTDVATGLVWLKDGDCARFHGLDDTGQNIRPWADAKLACSWLNNNHCGLTDGSKVGDWRLPDIKELASIIDYRVNSQTINTTALPIPTLYDQRYWSSTIPIGEDDDAWIVDFGLWDTGWDSDIIPYNVRCVRDQH